MVDPNLKPTPENFRSVMAIHRLSRTRVSKPIEMGVNLLSMYVTGYREMSPEAAHNIAYAINTIIGRRIFDIDMSLGVLPMPRAKRNLDRRTSVVLPVPTKYRRRRRPSPTEF